MATNPSTSTNVPDQRRGLPAQAAVTEARRHAAGEPLPAEEGELESSEQQGDAAAREEEEGESDDAGRNEDNGDEPAERKG